MSTLIVGDLRFEVRKSDRRRTLQLTVDRDGSLIAFTPIDCDRSVVEGFIRQKQAWIYKRLAEQAANRQPVAQKEYVSGEGFPYLGRNYRLLLVDEQAVPVKLEEGRFKMRRSLANEGRNHMIAWYVSHARLWLVGRVKRFSSRVGVLPAEVSVQDLGYRWGSCGKGRRLHFHWKSILLPPRMAEYLVLHELVHLYEAHHTPEFWIRVERSMPDYASRKEWLAENGHQAVVGF